MTTRALPNLTLPNAPERYDQKHMDRIQRMLENHWHPSPPVASGAFPMVLATDYGVVGDGVTDDTAAMQAALNACGSDGVSTPRVLYCGNLKVKISSGLQCNGLGIVFESGAQFGAGLYPVGSGYTAIKIGPGVAAGGSQVAQVRLSVFGNNNALNGVHFDNILASTVERVMVMDCDGFGIRIRDCFDTVFSKLTAYHCGNATDYAFDVGGTVDTTNECDFHYIQVELANTKAISMGDTNLTCRVGVIHSEQATAVAGVQTWTLGGARGTYGPCRFHANNPTAASLRLAGEHVEFHGISVEGAVPVTLSGESSSSMSLYEPAFGGTSVAVAVAEHSGPISIQGGDIGTLATELENNNGVSLMLYGVHVITMSLDIIGMTTPSPTLLQAVACVIGTLTSTSTQSCGTFTDCVIQNPGNLLQYATVLNNCTLQGSTGITVSGYVEMRNCRVTPAVTVGMSQTLIATGTRFEGGLTLSGNVASLFDAGCSVGGAVSGIGIPNQQPAVQSGLTGWLRGHRMHNLSPASGSPTGWVCTTPGANSFFVFKPEANLP